ncbi:hypothetical protein Tco_1451148 [Tanacetum coccineum]
MATDVQEKNTYFADVVSATENPKRVNFRALFNTETREDSDFVLPLECIKAVKHKFKKSLVGYFVGKSVAFTLVKNYVTNTWGKFSFEKVMKDDDGFFFFKFASINGVEQVLEQVPWLLRNTPLILQKWKPNISLTKDKVTKVPVWVKMHRVPTVSYSEDGLSLIGSQIGKPIMLDAFTSAMCVDPWGRIGFARALIEVSTEKELKEEVIMAVPFEDGIGCTKERIRTSGDGFTTVTSKKKNKGKAQIGGNTKKSNGFKVNNLNANLQYRPVTVQKDNSAKTNEDPSVEDPNSVFISPNSFDALCDNDDSVKDEEDSDSEVEESYVVYDSNTIVIKGASTPSNDDLDVYVCAILESHVDLSALSHVCSQVFRSWDWTSNANLCSKGCRIIVGWNTDVVNLMVLSQSNQTMHVKIVYKSSNKIMFCTSIYASNSQTDRRMPWEELGLHKNFTRGSPWNLMGDFNVALNLEDYHSGPSSLNSAMNEFKDCVAKNEVMDVNASGLHYTWNQKPRGGGGVLNKLDRIMGNMDFIDSYPGAFALFQPYRISDHSLAVLKIPTLTIAKPKPFKFFNFITFKERLLGVVSEHWKMNTSGHFMFQVVSKLKVLKKPMRKLVHDQGNLHDRVNRLRVELDEVQKDLY